MQKSTKLKIKATVVLSIVTAAILYSKNRSEKIKCIMGVEKGFAKTKKELEQLGLNPESVSEFLNYTFKSVKTLEKEIRFLNKEAYSKENIKYILIISFNLSNIEADAIIENYEILEIFEDNIYALDYLINTLRTEQLNKESFKKLISELYNEIQINSLDNKKITNIENKSIE